MAKYTTTDTPELVYDRVCTTVKVEEPVVGQEQQIEVKTVAETDPNEGCTDLNTRKLTLCLRPVKGNKHASDDNYRSKAKQRHSSGQESQRQLVKYKKSR